MSEDHLRFTCFKKNSVTLSVHSNLKLKHARVKMIIRLKLFNFKDRQFVFLTENAC